MIPTDATISVPKRDETTVAPAYTGGIRLFFGTDGVLRTVDENGTVSVYGTSATSGYTFTQNTPLAEWTVAHNLGYKPLVQIFSLGSNQVEAEIVHLSINTFRVIFNNAFSGYAKYL